MEKAKISEQSNTATAELDGKEKFCLNCGTKLHDGNYCHICGQPASAGRLTTKNLGIHILSGLTRINKQFLTTILNLTYRPWRVAADYIKGKRARYVAPVQLLIVLIFISLAITSFMGREWGLSERYGQLNLVNGDSATAAGINYVARYLITSLTWVYLLMLIPTIPVLRLFHRMAGIKKYNTAEYIVAALYMSCFILTMSIIFQIPSIIARAMPGSDFTMPKGLLLAIVLTMFCISFYKSLGASKKGVVTKILMLMLFVLSTFIFYLAIIAGFAYIHYG